jgi:hypothetical protein
MKGRQNKKSNKRGVEYKALNLSESWLLVMMGWGIS